MSESLVECSWEEFQATGLIWWINRNLHLFGWALVRKYRSNEDGTTQMIVYPARCKYRGFTEELEEAGFKKLTNYLASNVENLLKDME